MPTQNHKILLCVFFMSISMAKSNDLRAILLKIEALEEQVQTIKEFLARQFREVIETQDLIKSLDLCKDNES